MVKRSMRFPSLLIDILLSEDELIAFLEKERDRDCDNDDYLEDECVECHDDDEEKEDDIANQRLVLIFDTWPEGSLGPRGIS